MSDRPPEKFLFLLPAFEEEFLAAVAVLQSFLKGRTGEVRCLVSPQIVQSELPVGVGDFGFSGSITWDTKSLLGQFYTGDFDLVFAFDEYLAFELAVPTEKHLAQMFGIMLGCETRSLPVLNFPEVQMECDILVQGLPQGPELVALLETSFPALHTVPVPVAEVGTVRGTRKIVVGERSAATYVAASLGKGVVEVYSPQSPDGEDGFYSNWLSKWENPLYRMIYSRPEEVSASLLFRSVADLIVRMRLD